LLSVAVYIPTGMVTNPKLMAPFQMALGMDMSLCGVGDMFPDGDIVGPMLLRKAVLDAIVAGDVDLAFRRWKRPTVKTGGTLRTPAGLLQIESVARIDLGDIDEASARRAGMPYDELIGFLRAKDEGDVYRVELGVVLPDPRVALREDDRLAADDIDRLLARLDRFDGASKRGPWTRQFLELLAENPHVRAQDLADSLGLDKTAFKNDVRKLKAQGLTISHSPGYELSPRGLALLAHLKES
jgi:biotin operon repressor